MPIKRKTKVNYYKVAIPGDLYGPENVSVDTEDMTEVESETAINAAIIEKFGYHAIDEARERARLYVMPCYWEAIRISGEPGDHEVVFRVKRTHG